MYRLCVCALVVFVASCSSGPAVKGLDSSKGGTAYATASGRHTAELDALRRDLEQLLGDVDTLISDMHRASYDRDQIKVDPVYDRYYDDFLRTLVESDEAALVRSLERVPTDEAERARKILKIVLMDAFFVSRAAQLDARWKELARRQGKLLARMEGSLTAGQSPSEAEWQQIFQKKYLWKELDQRDSHAE